ncbi:response regulator transcription factor [Streptomyces sp. AM8-1-1]|uniref:response regulator transcription factor n=1 Tax=Streptomyces sp. AM8-1-1 TaxID=3075825 RepID=UPI0028C4C696|nr:response regulator transcription factor [Streptomyces sp. AM8-1-1]WNO74772.1 response regulator transcription factor [Streptomyces sp. AM8-1-1]
MRVILAEDSTLLREGLVRLLAEEGHEVLAAVGDAEQLLAAVEAHTPDVVVADVRMPPTHTDEGLRAALEIRRRRPEVGVLVLSQYVEKRYATELLTPDPEGPQGVGPGAGHGAGHRGAGHQGVGYLLKDRVVQVDEFLDALERVGRGRAAFDPEVVRQLLARSSRTDPLSRLTARERDVLGEMAQGHTNASIAAHLHVSQSAVEKHINAIFDKLGLTGLTGTTGYSRRVLAVLRYLGS